LAVRRLDFVSCGGFPELIRPYYYEDLAFGCRLLGPQRQGLYYHPEARVLHRHPMSFEQYLDREELLGIMAPVLAKQCPDAFGVLMANRAVQEIEANFREKLKADHSIYQRIYDRMVPQLALPAASLGQGDAACREIDRLYQLHIPVKLLAFRLGFLKGISLVEDSSWRDRNPTGDWRRYVT
jgi:hypothetical protein